jgi:methyl-accepting chemotaxis protein
MEYSSLVTKPYKRRYTNFLLQPMVQIRIGLVNIAASVLFVAALGIYSYRRLVTFADVVTTLTQADTEVKGLLADYLGSVGMTAALVGVVFLLVNLTLSVYLTHKLVGPTIAFRRHINALAQGDFRAHTKLRVGDAFGEVADDLNRLSDKLDEMLLKPPQSG